MKEIRVIGDEVETIVNTAREFSKKYDYVFTSG
jgi:molybdopterin-biosynthesis enzyme MoeA-like protein